MAIPAMDASEVCKYGSTVHIIAGAKFFNVNILVFDVANGWSLYTPDIEIAPSVFFCSATTCRIRQSQPFHWNSGGIISTLLPVYSTFAICYVWSDGFN